MKKRTFTLLLLSLFVLKSAAQQVEQVQRSLITKRTATWCPNCGTWGWAFFHNLIDDNKDKAVFLAAHYDGLLETTASNEITTNFGGSYQPIFFLNHTNMNVTSSNASATRVTVKNAVDAAYGSPPTANVGFSPYYTGSEIRVDAKVKFFQPGQGEFYLGTYLVENNVIEYQASIGNNANHQKVLRHSFTQSSWGEPLASGDVASGQEFEKTFSLAIGDPSGYAYEVVGVIWKKVDGKYEVVNVWSTSQFAPPNAASDIQPLAAFEVKPSINATTAEVVLDVSGNLPNVVLDLLDITGKRVSLVFEGALPAGQHSFSVSSADATSKGMYLVRLTHGKKTVARKVVFN